MEHGIEGFIEKTQRARTMLQLRQAFFDAMRKEGYENVVYASTRNKVLDSVVWNEFPQGYLDVYRADRWDKIDPVLHHIQRTRRPFRWADAVSRMPLTRRQKAFLNECRELGVHSGVTFPLHGPGSRVDLVSLSLRHESQVPEHRLSYLYALAVQTSLRRSQLIDPPEMNDLQAVHLTDKELEVVRWAKDGKTNREIGELMSLSEKTIEFHMSNVIKKLGADNRITAVVMAIQQGLIAL
jgi:DNA-binding CsgD family transcriptional regulator